MPLTALLTGLGLAAAAGFNAWAVLLLFHGLYRLLPQEFPGAAAAILGSQTVLGFALVLFLAEFVITKIPMLDRFWELAHTLRSRRFRRPLFFFESGSASRAPSRRSRPTSRSRPPVSNRPRPRAAGLTLPSP